MWKSVILNFARRRSWLTVSKAFERSIKITPTYFPLSKEAFHFSSILIRLYCVLWFFRNPQNLTESLFFMKSSVCLHISLSNTWHMWQNVHWSIILLIEGILFLENWDYISKFKLVWKLLSSKDELMISEYWKVGVNRPLKQIYWDISFPSSFFVVKI